MFVSFCPNSEIPHINPDQRSPLDPLYQIKHTKIENRKNGSEVRGAFIYDSSLEDEGYPIYHLKDQRGMLLGLIHLKVIRNHVYIDKIFAASTSIYSGIGRALHEFAIFYSFWKGCKGQVELKASNASSGFHFKCGFRFDDPIHPTIEGISPGLWFHCKNNFAALENGISINVVMANLRYVVKWS